MRAQILRKIIGIFYLSSFRAARLIICLTAALLWMSEMAVLETRGAPIPGNSEHDQSQSRLNDSKISIEVKGSSCVACLKSLQKALSELSGVNSVQVVSDALTVTGGANPPKSHKSKKPAVYVISFNRSEISRDEIETFIRGRDFRIVAVHVVRHQVVGQ
jgi:copper chaperone CopZ